MAAAWPSTLPQSFLVKGFQRAGPTNTIRSETLSGRVKAQRVSTKTHRQVSGQVMMTTAQVAIFETFYRTTLLDGSQPFQDLTNPLTGANTVWQFLEDPTEGHFADSQGHWLIPLVLLALPDAPV